MRFVAVLFTTILALAIFTGPTWAEESTATPATAKTAEPAAAPFVPSLSGFVQVQTANPDIAQRFILDSGLFYSLTEQWTLSAYLLLSGNWAEGYFGPIYTPIKYIQLNPNIGADQYNGEFRLRYAINIWVTYEKLAFSGSFEFNNDTFRGGNDGHWYDLNITYQPLDWLIVGLKDRRCEGNGFGPMVRFKYWKAELWFAWAPLAAEKAKFQPDTFMIGLMFNL